MPLTQVCIIKFHEKIQYRKSNISEAIYRINRLAVNKTRRGAKSYPETDWVLGQTDAVWGPIASKGPAALIQNFLPNIFNKIFDQLESADKNYLHLKKNRIYECDAGRGGQFVLEGYKLSNPSFDRTKWWVVPKVDYIESFIAVAKLPKTRLVRSQRREDGTRTLPLEMSNGAKTSSSCLTSRRRTLEQTRCSDSRFMSQKFHYPKFPPRVPRQRNDERP